MRDIYSKAAKEHVAMRREAAERRRVRRDEELGRFSLFPAEELAAGSPGEEARYLHEPPWAPYGQSGGGPRRDPGGLEGMALRSGQNIQTSRVLLTRRAV